MSIEALKLLLKTLI